MGSKNEIVKAEKRSVTENDSPKVYVSHAELFAPSFWRLYNDIQNHRGREYWLKGGRGSTKSSFISTYISGSIVEDGVKFAHKIIPKSDLSHAVAYRKIGSDVRDSVFTQFIWSLEKMRILPWFDINRSSMRIKFAPTGQQILMRGLDDALKSKSIKAPFGFFKYLWFEELTQFAGMEEIRSVKQSVLRGGHDFVTFCSYNPAITMSNWVNVAANEVYDGRVLHHSDYRDVPHEWLGDEWYAEAEALKKNNYRLYAHEYLGAVTGTGGSVFPNLHVRVITDDEISHFDNLCFGLDWGFTNAFAACQCHIDFRNKILYIFGEIYQSHMTPSQAAEKVRQWDLHGEYIYADPEDKASIEQFNNEYGIPTKGAIKGADSRRFLYRFLQSFREIVICPIRCPNGAKEFQLCEFEKDKDGNFIEEYPKKNDHFIDSVRYAVERFARIRGLF